MTIEITEQSALLAFIGGTLIGLGAAILLLFNGRVAGVAGITRQLLNWDKDRHWRLAFLLGLIVGGIIFKGLMPYSFPSFSLFPFWQVALAGVLVGFGVSQGNGCTSGHGVCGISRFSMRSVVATLTFMSMGFLTVFVLRLMGLVR